MCLAQVHNAVTPVRLEPAASRSRVKYSTTGATALPFCPAGAWLQMTGAHNLFRLYVLLICDHCPQPRRKSRTLILCLQFPIITTTLWGQVAGKTMTVLPRSLLLYCTAMLVYVSQTPTFPPHYGDNVKVKSQHICQAIPALLWGMLKQWLQITGTFTLFIAYAALQIKI